MKEQQTRITILSNDGKEFKMLIRGKHTPHYHCSLGHDSQIGERGFFHECDFNMTRREGVVIHKVSLVWDYSLPIGQRETEVVISNGLYSNI